MKNIKPAIESREGEVVYDCEKYSIRKIPLNYQITYKVLNPYKTNKDGKPTKLIPQPHYNSLNFWPDLKDAIELAEFMVEKYTRIALSSK